VETVLANVWKPMFFSNVSMVDPDVAEFEGRQALCTTYQKKNPNASQ